MSNEPEHKARPKRKANLPTKALIAEYWASQQIEGNPLVDKINRSISWDWGEPCCWACGIGPPFVTGGKNISAEDIDYRVGERLFTCWNRARFLERCHIVPESRGGSNDPENLLLLCKECHRDAPDSINPMFMNNFVVNRENRITEEYNFIVKLISQYGLSSDMMSEIYQYYQDNKDEFEQYAIEHTLIGQSRFGATPRSKQITEFLAAIIDFHYKQTEVANESR